MALLKDHLIAHYKMNDDAATAVVVDETGNHNGEYQLNGVAQNTSIGTSVGKIFGALDFVGGVNGEHVEVADHDDFSPILTPFSVSVWVYMNDATNFQIVTKYDTNKKEFVCQCDVLDKVKFWVYDNSALAYRGKLCNTPLTPYQNQWIYLVFTYDGGILSSGLRIYLNGVQIDDTVFEGGIFISVENLTSPVMIGRRKDEGTFANGLIDNAMFFNKELSLLEVKLLYNGGAGTENIPSGIQLSRTGQRFSSFPEN